MKDYLPDARGWIGIGVFALSVMLLWMMTDRGLREDEFFQTIATVIISNGLMAVIAWAYSATKGGGEQAEVNARIAEKLTASSVDTATAVDVANATPGKPLPVEVVQPPGQPVPVTETPDPERKEP